ncbi:MAG: TonB-dependent receptor [Verrucomicrobiales bacterium]|nr:TonB-dependent receptor [Verrucomicrobiales bacterium]
MKITCKSQNRPHQSTKLCVRFVPEIRFSIPLRFRIHFTYRDAVRRWFVFLFPLLIAAQGASAQTNALASKLIEAAGQVEVATTKTNWQTAAVGTLLNPGARVRTHKQSRAAVQLSDRSVIRLNEETTLEILPPRAAEKKRFGLPSGIIYFFNREKPADVEFDTPLAAGAIRGTEFLLEATDDQQVHLALVDGLVTLNTPDAVIELKRGEDLRLAPGKAPQKTALLNVNAQIQWALYYPAVVNPAELDGPQAGELNDVLKRYRSGDLLGALNSWPTQEPANHSSRILHAQLLLAVGDVSGAEHLINDSTAAPANALRMLIAMVRGTQVSTSANANSSSGLLAQTYAFQFRGDLVAARNAAVAAAKIAPQFGFAHARLAELDFAFGERKAALKELDTALKLSPQLPSAYIVQGFVQLEQYNTRAALESFDHARQLDAALGTAWLGRGLCLIRDRQFAEARSAFQAAAALEPQRSLFRSYLAKAAGNMGDAKAAQKDFRLAKELDPNDPTAWLYSALYLSQENKLNDAIRDLETSADLNDNQSVFRSRLLLDRDRAVRSANLAALYDDAGIPDASRRAAARSVTENYVNFSGHLFLANSLQTQENANRFDLRLETARQSELLVANLLAPPGAGNLSQQLSQQEHLRFFEQRPVNVSSLSEFRSNGDLREEASFFGSHDGFSYALDLSAESLHGQQPNGQADRNQLTLTMKQRITPDDDVYFQIARYNAKAGDVAMHYDPQTAERDFHVHEKQEPTLYGGWHHEWSPGSHTLLLVARLDDSLWLHDPMPNVPFLVQGGGATVGVESPEPVGLPLQLDITNTITLYSAELQHIRETPRQSLIVGGRFQSADLGARGMLNPDAGGPLVTSFNKQNADGSLHRENAYVYYSFKPFDSLRLIGGGSYDHISFPENLDLPPLSSRETSRDLFAPKAGLLFNPWQRGQFRAAYSQSLGGLYFDNSVRLEPTQIAGFTQGFRSLVPESVAGLVPGTKFETKSIGFDQSFRSGTWFGVEAEQLESDGNRSIGALTNSTFIPFADSPSITHQSLKFRENSLGAYAGQLIGNYYSVGARYQFSEATLHERFPDIPNNAQNLPAIQADNRATYQELSLGLNFHHPSGVFAQWESLLNSQSNHGYTPALPGDTFWQHNVSIGYRFPRRFAEIRCGILNLFDRDYRLNPLNIHADFPRTRTFVASLKLNF